MNGTIAIVNANVVPMTGGERFSALYIKDGRIEKLGTDEEIRDLATVEVFDANGATVLPGFFDCHVHGLMTGMNSLGIDLYDCPDLSAVMALLKEADETWEPGRFVFGKRLDESRVAEGRPPVMEELDAISRPVLLSDRGGHYVALNRAAYDALEIKDDMRGVRFDENGRPTGRLQDQANKYARTRFFELWSVDQRRDAVRNTAALAVKKGITTVEAMEGFDSGDDDIRMMHAMKDELPIDMNIFWASLDVNDPLSLGMDRWGGDILLDGTIGSRTAAFREKYSDGDGCGYTNYSDETVFGIIDTALKNDMCISFHVIGELGLFQGLEQMERALDANPEKRGCHKLRLEHFGFPRQEDIDRCARLGVVLSTQPAFTYLRGGPGTVYRSRLGEKRERAAYPLRRFADAGIIMGGGSDSDITPMDPLLGIHAAVNPPYPENALTPFEAVRMYTSDAAKCAYQFDTKGTLEAGKQGDAVVLAADPMKVPSNSIKDVKVIMTIRKGEIVYRA